MLCPPTLCLLSVVWQRLPDGERRGGTRPNDGVRAAQTDLQTEQHGLHPGGRPHHRVQQRLQVLHHHTLTQPSLPARGVR